MSAYYPSFLAIQFSVQLEAAKALNFKYYSLHSNQCLPFAPLSYQQFSVQLEAAKALNFKYYSLHSNQCLPFAPLSYQQFSVQLEAAKALNFPRVAGQDEAEQRARELVRYAGRCCYCGVSVCAGSRSPASGICPSFAPACAAGTSTPAQTACCKPTALPASVYAPICPLFAGNAPTC